MTNGSKPGKSDMSSQYTEEMANRAAWLQTITSRPLTQEEKDFLVLEDQLLKEHKPQEWENRRKVELLIQSADNIIKFGMLNVSIEDITLAELTQFLYPEDIKKVEGVLRKAEKVSG